jgi:hypothetical protein
MQKVRVHFQSRRLLAHGCKREKSRLRLVQMKNLAFLLVAMLAVTPLGAKQHVIAFGKPMTVKWFTGPSESKAQELRIRGLYIDSKLREFVVGDAHEVTDQSFVVRRAFRVNDLLPGEGGVPKWKWQRDGWLFVDRESGHISSLKLPEFDPFYSVASWYRDYAAFCGVSDDGEKLYAVVAQIGRKKAVVRKELGAAHGGDEPDSECPAPEWQRQPARVTFHPQGGAPVSFDVRGSSAEVAAPWTTQEKDEN